MKARRKGKTKEKKKERRKRESKLERRKGERERDREREKELEREREKERKKERERKREERKIEERAREETEKEKRRKERRKEGGEQEEKAGKTRFLSSLTFKLFSPSEFERTYIHTSLISASQHCDYVRRYSFSNMCTCHLFHQSAFPSQFSLPFFQGTSSSLF